jgi:hypothetical protein
MAKLGRPRSESPQHDIVNFRADAELRKALRHLVDTHSTTQSELLRQLVKAAAQSGRPFVQTEVQHG